MKLAALWVIRILFAPNHFKVPLYKRIWHAVFGGYMADQIALYDFKNNKKREYLSEFDWYKSRSINDPYSGLLNNKVVFAEMLRPFCPCPEVYAVKKGKRIAGLHGREISNCEDLIDLLHEKGAMVIKPVNIGKGLGVRVLKAEDGFITENGKPVYPDKLILELKKGGDWHACEYAYQAQYLNKIYAPSANTIRMIVLRSAKTREMELCFAVQRLGARRTGAVDNGSRGGLVANIDIETGTLSEARSLHDLNVYPVHPDTKAPIQGVVIPNWERIKRGVLAASGHFPYLDIIAWDILPTADGSFTVIEGNTSSGVNIIQLWGPQRHGRLGEFYREHGVIK